VISYIRWVARSANGHIPADEFHDRRRRRHGEPADAAGLGDRRVADVGVGVLGP
jgi:hypothetical protein